jgi:hypothetical protein
LDRNFHKKTEIQSFEEIKKNKKKEEYKKGDYFLPLFIIKKKREMGEKGKGNKPQTCSSLSFLIKNIKERGEKEGRKVEGEGCGEKRGSKGEQTSNLPLFSKCSSKSSSNPIRKRGILLS